MLEFPVRPRYPQLRLCIKLILMTTSPSWCLDYLMPGNWPGRRFKDLKRSRSPNMIGREISQLVTGYWCICPMNKVARIENFPDHTLALIGCWKYIQMVSLFDQLTLPMINLSG